MTNTTKRKIFVDFEWHPISYDYQVERETAKEEIIEFGAVMLDSKGKEIGRFQSYVKPRYVNRISSRIQRLTGILDETLADAKDYCDVLAEFIGWCKKGRGGYEIYSWSDRDLAQVKSESQLKNVPTDEDYLYMTETWYDLQHKFDHILGFENQLSLQNAMYLAGLDPVGVAHSAIYDAVNTSALYVFLSDPKKQETTIKTIRCAMGQEQEQVVTLGSMVDWGALMAVVG